MIDISLTKLLLLAVVALIVLGPERLPHAARTAGALLRRMRSGWDSVRSEVEREIQAEEIKRTLRETAENARATHDSVREDIRATGAGILETGEQVRDTFAETQVAPTEAREPDPARDMLPLKNDSHDRT
ncbi:Sec-independent protein translocase protein TatB [Luteibacter sp.]|jgi:sec-independent protein translocase protein TatB|uniref:Sec-independent protein translocase protein TatB n=1 Tax=Luteibacter sp. TaxID=1886636 RepID=UPI002F41ABFA